MMRIDDLDEFVSILINEVTKSECGHVSYVANEGHITKLLAAINMYSDITPELINFNNNDPGEYVFELDCDEDITYSIWPAAGEDGIYYPNYGLCFVSKNISNKFENDYDKYADHDDYYIKPIRVYILEDEDEDCDNCDVSDCPNRNNNLSSSESVRIDTDDNGNISGFTKKWTNDHSFFSYTYHSTNEDDVLDVMNKFGINK